jgi:hypothetical protein
MTRYHSTITGDVPYTTEEESKRDAEEVLWADGADERSMAELREQRNRLLAETDWTANSDVTMSPEMAEYRKSLRDLPATVDINNIIYPEKP